MKVFRNYSKWTSSLGGVYILSSVRTPIGLSNGVLREFTAPQLGSFAIKEALQRAAVPSGHLQNVFLGCVSCSNCQEEVIKRTGLSKSTAVSLVPTCGMKSFLDAIKFLLKNNNQVCIAGGMESISNSPSTDSYFFSSFVKIANEDVRKLLKSSSNGLQDRKKYAEKDYNSFLKSNRNVDLYEEIMEIDFRKKGQQIWVTEDEMLQNHLAQEDIPSPTPGDGGAAFTLSTEDYYTGNNLVPLGKIISFAEEFANSGDVTSAQQIAIEKALKAAGCKYEAVARWEIVSVVSDDLNKNSSKMNKNEDVGSIRCPFGMSGLRAVCHLVHSLANGELGCAASCDMNGTAYAVIVKKVVGKKSGKPQLTLYTKHACSLCDDLKQQLKPFEGRFSLREVDIEAKENEKYNELYQYVIPVLFLDGTFLCKHRLNVEHFTRRLLAAEKAS